MFRFLCVLLLNAPLVVVATAFTRGNGTDITPSGTVQICVGKRPPPIRVACGLSAAGKTVLDDRARQDHYGHIGGQKGSVSLWRLIPRHDQSSSEAVLVASKEIFYNRTHASFMLELNSTTPAQYYCTVDWTIYNIYNELQTTSLYFMSNRLSEVVTECIEGTVVRVVEGRTVELTCIFDITGALNGAQIRWYKYADEGRYELAMRNMGAEDAATGIAKRTLYRVMESDAGVYSCEVRFDETDQTFAQNTTVIVQLEPSAPLDFRADLHDAAGVVRLFWTSSMPRDPFITANATLYLVKHKALASSVWFQASTTVPLLVITDLKPATFYEFRLSAQNEVGHSVEVVKFVYVPRSSDSTKKCWDESTVRMILQQLDMMEIELRSMKRILVSG